ncbi:MAG: flippase-like domain-containing protein [Candidatus Altiarchaeota archaeon]|nr:flippase-like domain-containing protein [Candidatus Altiarchaeota archaeon]
MKKENIRLIIAFGIGFIILAYLFSSMGLENILELLLRVRNRPHYFILAAFAYFGNEIIGAYILKMALYGRIRLRKIIPSHMCGMLYSSVTPGRVGYYYTAFSLSKKMKDSRSRNIGILTLIQGITFFVKVVSCIIAVVYFSRLLVKPEYMDYLIMASLVPIVFVVLIAIVIYTNLANRFASKIPFVKEKLNYVVLMQDAGKEVKAAKIFKIMLITIIGWFFVGAQWFFLAEALGLGISYWDAFMLQPLLSAVMFIPITPGGLGITEGGSALLFTLLLSSIPSTEAKAAGVTFILLVRFNSIVVDAFGLIDMKIHGKS